MTVVIPGKPVPQPRPKVCRRGGFVSTFTPDNGIVAFKADVALRVRAALAGKVHRGPVKIAVAFEFVRPPSHFSITKKNGKVLKATAPEWVVDGDWDNFAKGACDAINGIAYGDDIQIVDAHVTKRYGVETVTTITIERAMP